MAFLETYKPESTKSRKPRNVASLSGAAGRNQKVTMVGNPSLTGVAERVYLCVTCASQEMREAAKDKGAAAEEMPKADPFDKLRAGFSRTEVREG
jgi:hypothetical protein